MMTRMAELLVLEAIRGWLLQSEATHRGWLRALRDPQLGAAIALIHRKASHAWTIDSLAAAVGMSRALFCKRFQEVAGVAPMKYLTRWRMHLAQHWMKTEHLSLSAVATKLGYSSEASFSRAFKRHLGISPGAARSA